MVFCFFFFEVLFWIVVSLTSYVQRNLWRMLPLWIALRLEGNRRGFLLLVVKITRSIFGLLVNLMLYWFVLLSLNHFIFLVLWCIFFMHLIEKGKYICFIYFSVRAVFFWPFAESVRAFKWDRFCKLWFLWSIGSCRSCKWYYQTLGLGGGKEYVCCCLLISFNDIKTLMKRDLNSLIQLIQYVYV